MSADHRADLTRDARASEAYRKATRTPEEQAGDLTPAELEVVAKLEADVAQAVATTIAARQRVMVGTHEVRAAVRAQVERDGNSHLSTYVDSPALAKARQDLIAAELAEGQARVRNTNSQYAIGVARNRRRLQAAHA